jgi:K+-sensing histidine kinase KdpD
MLAAIRNIMRALGGDSLPATSWLAYVFAVLCVSVAAVAHIAVLQILDGVTPSILYNPAIFIAALIGGAGAGSLAAGLGLVFLGLTLSVHVSNDFMLNHPLGWALYLLTAVFIVFIALCYRAFADVGPSAAAQGCSERKRERTGGRVARFVAERFAPHSFASYLFALACILIASWIRLSFAVDGGTLPLAAYYPAILLAALAGGTGPGLLAMLASLMVLAAESPRAILSFEPPAREDGVNLALYVFACLLSIWLAEKHRHAGVLSSSRQSMALKIVSSVLVAMAAILVTTLVLLAIDSYLDADHLVLGYLLPTVVIAMHYGGLLAVLTSFAGSAAAAYFLFPPKFSFYVSAPNHIAELGLFLVLAIIASKAVVALTDDIRQRDRRSREA